MRAADAGATLEVGEVPRAEEGCPHPFDEQLLESPNFGLAALQRATSIWMVQNPLVKDVGDAREVRLCKWMELAESFRIALTEAGKPKKLFEDAVRHPEVRRYRPLVREAS